MKKIISMLIICVFLFIINGCLSSRNNTQNEEVKQFGVLTFETIKKQYLNNKYLFVEENTEFLDYEDIDLNNIFTITDVKMRKIDEETIDYILIFKNDDIIREQKYGQLYINIQNVVFFEYNYFIIGDTINIYNNEIEIQYDRRNKESIEKQKYFYRAYYPLEAFMITYEKFKSEGPIEYIPPNGYNVNKLTALLLNPMSAGTFGQFTKNEDVKTTRALLRVIDMQRSSDTYIYLVAINDYNVQKPFYIISNRMLNLMNLDYKNTIIEDLWLKYLDIKNYTSNGITRETYLFQIAISSSNTSQRNKDNDFIIEMRNNEAIIIKYSGTTKNIVIPNNINGFPVVEIGSKVFLEKGIRTVILPNTLRIIGDQAFHKNNISKIDIPFGVTTIGEWAFARNNITEVIIPNSVTTIKHSAFLLNKLTSISIPNSVTLLGDGAFACNNISSFSIPKHFKRIPDSLFYENSLKEVIIYDNIEYILSQAFWKNKIETVVISNNVKEISSSSFRDNPIKKIVIGDNVKLHDNSHNPSFPFEFAKYYNSNNKKAGTYLYNDVEWSYLAGR